MKKYAVISNGIKQLYLYNHLRNNKANVTLLNNFTLKPYDYIVCSIPFAHDNIYVNCDFYSSYPVETFIDLLVPGQTIISGNINNVYANYLNEKRINCIDMLKYDDFIYGNSKLTAEGLLGKIICSYPSSLYNSTILLLGYGNCGKEIANILKNFNCKIYFYEQDFSKINAGINNGLIYIEHNNLHSIYKRLNILINTVPKHILSNADLKQLYKDCFIYDIASKPFGFDEKLTSSLNINLHICSGIPGKYKAKASGELIAQNILSILEGASYNEQQAR